MDVRQMALNIKNNPLSYCLALNGAVLWALYCTVTKRIAEGKNAVTLFFAVTAVLLWVKFFTGDEPAVRFTGTVAACALMASAALGFGYAAWNVGMLHGNTTVLATCSYFTPVLSSLLSSFMLDTQLTLAFWKGALLVCAGSLLCWYSMRTKAVQTPTPRPRARQRARRQRAGV